MHFLLICLVLYVWYAWHLEKLHYLIVAFSSLQGKDKSAPLVKQSREELGVNHILRCLEKTKTTGSPKILSAKNQKFTDCLPANVKYKRFTLEEIEKATDNFSDALKIGEGGYGPVYKCSLDDTLVAIKILRSDVTQGIKQFIQEVTFFL